MVDRPSTIIRSNQRCVGRSRWNFLLKFPSVVFSKITSVVFLLGANPSRVDENFLFSSIESFAALFLISNPTSVTIPKLTIRLTGWMTKDDLCLLTERGAPFCCSVSPTEIGDVDPLASTACCLFMAFRVYPRSKV